MKIIFENIKIHNFLSLGDAEVKLDTRGYVLISGVNNNPADNAKSNGSGKSSIAEAIVWALTGDTFRGIKNVVNMFADGGTYVDITFKANGKNYRIVRYKEYEKLGNNLKFYVNGEDKSGKGIRDTDDIISNYLPELTTQLIGSIIILGQGLPLRFSNNTPSGRKDVLEKLSKSDFMIEDIKSKITGRKGKLQNELRIVEDAALTLTTKKNLFEQQLVKLKADLDNISDPIDITNNISEIDENLNIIESNLSDLNDDYARLELDLTTSEQQLTELTDNVTTNKTAVYNEINPQIETLRDELSSYQSQANYLRSEIRRLESITDVCPTCHQKLPDVIKPDTTEQRQSLFDVENNIKVTQQKISELKAQLDSRIFDIEAANKQTIEQIRSERQLIQSKQKQTQSDIAKLTGDKNNLLLKKSNLENQLNTLENKKVELTNQISDTSNNITDITDQLLYNKAEQDKLNNHISIINKMFTIATRDFRGQLLSSVIDFIDKKAKEYAKHVFNTDNISFALEGNAINISYDNKQLESLSGGERQKVDLIIQFALRDMMCQYLSFTSNILFVDECFDGLDVVGCQKIIDLIAENICDVESIFIITHHSSELAIPYDDEIIIVKNPSGVSYIQ